MGEYEQEWRRYRRLIAYNIAAFLGAFPFTIGATVISEKLLHTDALFPYFAGFSVALWLLSGLRLCAFNCPRCGKCFIGRWWYGHAFLVGRCAHCRLPREPKAISLVVLFGSGAVAVVLIAAALSIPTLDGPGSRRLANESAAVENLQKLTTLQTEYSASHPAKGFSCELAALKPVAPSNREYDAYQFLVTESHLGYKFTLSACEIGPNGAVIHYQATAVPLVPGKSGDRAFCTDQSGVLWYDPTGLAGACLAAHRPI